VPDVDTPHGPARVELRRPSAAARGALVLGHGAGGGTGARDLQAAADVALEEGLAVALVEQPYRVAGRKSPAPAAQLDAAWTAVLAQLARSELRALPMVAGGRSSGARVACRTAGAVGAAGVLCLAFPVHLPGRGDDPASSRLPELDAVRVPVLVVQGEADAFGMPPDAPGREVVRLRGTHSLSSDLPGLRDAVRGWLRRTVP